MIRRLPFILLAAMSLVVVIPQPSFAVTAADWQAGRIIDDPIFENSTDMSAQDIQSFLDNHIANGSCDKNGDRRLESSYWAPDYNGDGRVTHSEYAQYRGYGANYKFTCLNNYYEVPKTTPGLDLPVNNYGQYNPDGSPFIPPGSVSAAQIIYNTAQKYHLNPKVLLVKIATESAGPLTSDDWPFPKQYYYAMGSHCPDSGPNGSPNCDANYAGFSIQIDSAGDLLRWYLDSMTQSWWRSAKPGQVKNILWNVVETGCGGGDVYIETKATAALYTYTPYQPNQAALNNMYSTGNGCSAYGNRNFWRTWSDWFGWTRMNSNLLRTVDNSTVYLIGDNIKYPIADMSTFGALSAPLGGVGFVSQSYLDNIPTGQVANRLLRGPDGTIYFYDSAIKLPFTSCWLVEQYGYGCGSAMQLSQAQIDRFANGPLVTQGMKTTNGKTFIIKSGTKSEVFDDASLSGAGIKVGFNVLSDEAFNYLGYGVPIIRNDVIVSNRNTNTKQLYSANTLTALTASTPVKESVKSLPNATLDDQSLKKLTSTNATISDLIQDDNGVKYILTTDGKKLITDYQADTSSSVHVPSSAVSLMTGSGSLTSPALIKGIGNGTVYAIINNQKRPIVAMEYLESITGVKNPPIAWVSDSYVDTIPTGNIIVGAGRLVMTPSNATVYMTDGTDKLFPMSSFTPAIDLGVNLNIRVISDQILSKYTVSNQLLSQYVSCGGTSYLGLDGAAYKVTIPNATPLVLDQKTCNVIKKQDNFPRFLLRNDGTIFLVDNMKIRPIRSYPTYSSLLKDGDVTARASMQALNLFEIGESL